MKLIVCLITFLLVFSSFAVGSMMIPANENAKRNARAPEKSPVIGENWDLERVDFIHYAKGGNKPDKPPKGGKDVCYKLMGVKWKGLPVDYVINPTGDFNIVNASSISAETWDGATSSDLFGNVKLI